MHLLPSRSTQLARLFSLLSQGERIAHLSAAKQSQLMTQHGNTSHAKFFKQQSRQERFHAHVFSNTALWLGSRKINTQCTHLKEFEKNINNALNRRDITESILAVQVILESVGKLVLEGIDTRMERQSYGLKKIRSVILAQEAEHHEFGHAQLLNMKNRSCVSLPDLRQQAQHYQALAINMFDELAPLFDHLGADIDRYKSELRQEIPAHLRLN